jgi:hypothetical protein
MREKGREGVGRRDPATPPPSLRVDPVGPVDDDGVSLRCSMARCATCVSTGRVARDPTCLVGDVCPDETGSMSRRRVLWFDPDATDDYGLS